MKVCQLHSIGNFCFDNIDKPKPKGKELLIKVSSCGVCGSDIPRIYAHGTSNSKYPCVLGHEFGGEIVEVGSDANKSLIGKCGAVFPLIPCNCCEQCKTQYYAMCENYNYLGSRTHGGFAEYCLVPSDWNFVEAPDDINQDNFALVEPCTVAQHAVRKANYTNCDSLIIFGAGPIGIMAARWAKIFNIKNIMLVDVVQEKVDFANKLGIYCINSSKTKIYDAWNNFSNNKYCDAVIEGTGVGSVLGSSIDIVKPHGKIVLMGNPVGDTQIKLSQHSSILRKEVSICGIWNSYFKSKNIDEWKCSIDAISNRQMHVLDLITHKVCLQDLPQLCSDIYNKKVSICKAIFSSNI